MDSARLAQRLSLVSGHLYPRPIAQVNDFHVKIVNVNGEAVWHTREGEDATVLVLHGEQTVRMRAGDALLSDSEFFVVPGSVEHLPVSTKETSLPLVAKAGTDHTERTIEDQERINRCSI